MKATRKLIPAIALLLISAVLMSTASFAWFSMNNQVSVTGMQVKARADSGIVIKAFATNTGADIPASAAAFKTEAKWGMSSGTALYPVSTINAAKWYTASSDIQDDAKAGQGASNYSELTGVFSDYYAKYDYVIRSSATAVPVTNVKLAIKEVTVTQKSTTSENLNKAVRVAVVYGTTTPQVYIYAPLATENVTINPGYDNTGVTAKKVVGTTGDLNNLTYTDLFTLTSNTIPASDTGVTVSVYIYFEGEDANCKSTNITASLDSLEVAVTFTTVPTT